MPNLFDDEIQIVPNMNFDLAGRLSCMYHSPACECGEPPYRGYDRSYIYHACVKDSREKLENLWSTFEPYADTDFLKAIKERGQFLQRTWEMSCCNIFLNKGLSLVSREDKARRKDYFKKNEGPDFIVQKDGRDQLYIECVSPTKGCGKDKVPSFLPASYAEAFTPRPARSIPTNKIILRISSAIHDKMKQYAGWQKQELSGFNKDIPYVIAINTADLEWPDPPEPLDPYVVCALFGVPKPWVSLDKNSGQMIESEMKYCYHIKKLSTDANIPVNGFLTNSVNDLTHEIQKLSGVLFSHSDAVNCDQLFEDKCFYVNNPFARNPLDGAVFPNFFNGMEASLKRDGSVYIEEKNP